MEKEIKIIFENEDFLVVDKPSGMTTTKERKGEENTLEDFLVLVRKNDLPRNGIIHRLDKGTCGLVTVAKNNESWRNLKDQFKNRIVKKKYFCLAEGEVVMDGVIDWPMARSKYGFGKFGVDINGKRALTEFKLLEKYQKDGKKYSLLEINLKTGRTHQIRVHMSHLKWPLVGDKLYGGKDDGLGHPFLQAFYLEFNDPKTGERRRFELSLETGLKKYLEGYEKK